MDIIRWKKFKRSGGYRRKVQNELNSILKNTSEEKGESLASTDTTTNFTPGSVHNSDKMDDDCVSSAHMVLNNFEDGELNNSNMSNAVEEVKLTDIEKNLECRNQIRKWATSFNIAHAALNDLSRILNSRIPDLLPVDSRTLLCTPRKTNIIAIDNCGEYWHNGLEGPLIAILDRCCNVPENISLNINLDGLPIFKSSKLEFWPILCNIFEKPSLRPIIIGIYAGKGKPKDLNAYLDLFVTEVIKILQNGIQLKNGKLITVKIRCFICDSPARAFVKGVCNFNGKHGCLKCTTVGEYSHTSHTVTFPEANCLPRNNEDFRNMKYGGHHKIDSPLLKLPIDMVEDMPVSDSLHLLDLGIMKRLLTGWRDGNFGKYFTKWCARDISMVSNFLLNCKLPSEIHRSVRGLDELSHWKASEYRAFFYYISIIVLRDVLHPNAYHHFLTLFCAITICSSTKYFHFLPVAEKAILYFFEHYGDFYGQDYVTSNVHNLTHLVSEVKRFGALQTFSAYPFENELYLIKKLLRQGKRPLSQVAKRLSERAVSDMHINETEEITYPHVKKNNNHDAKLYFKDFVLSGKPPDKYFLTNENDIIELELIETQETKIKIYGKRLSNKVDFFDTPIKSSLLNIYKIPNTASKTESICYPYQIKCKLVKINHNDCIVFIPLLHTV